MDQDGSSAEPASPSAATEAAADAMHNVIDLPNAAARSRAALSGLEPLFTGQPGDIRSDRRQIAANLQLLEAIIESTDDAIVTHALDGTIVSWNSAAERMLGYSAEEIVGSGMPHLLPSDRKEELNELSRRVAAGERISHFETIRVHKNGALVDVSLSVSPIFENGRVVGVCFIGRDISARKRAEQELAVRQQLDRDHAARIGAILNSVPAAVLIAHDAQCTRITGNRASYDLLRLPFDTNLSFSRPDSTRPVHFRLWKNGRELEPHELPLQTACATGVEIRDYEMDVSFHDGTIRHVLANATPLHDADGYITGAVGSWVDITVRRLAEDQIRKLAHFDPLTNLPNRTLLMDRMEQALAGASRNQSRTGIIFLDLDHFKLVNDELGHHAGDLLLQQVAERIRDSVREVDTVSRLGGDEFVVVLPELREAEDATLITQKLLAVLSREYVVSGRAVNVTPSLGVSIFPEDGRDAMVLLRHADYAMYHAKQGGRNNFRFFAQDMVKG
jgi:diguanylate cyclase (GGDEF)-like protein/PAS domain S-box-containing protein